MPSSPVPHHTNPQILPEQLYFRIPEFTLESGEVFDEAHVAFTFRGRLNSRRDNAIVVCHGFIENANVEEWWSSLLDRVNPALDPNEYCIICCNYLGSPYGSSSPLTYRPGCKRKEERYASRFPRTTIRDDVRIHTRVLDIIGVRSIACVIGHGMGNMAALEWARLGPNYVRTMILSEKPGQQSSLSTLTPPDDLDQQNFDTLAHTALPMGFDKIDELSRRSFEGDGTARFFRQCPIRAIACLYDRLDKPTDFDEDCYVHLLEKVDSFKADLGRLSKSLDREDGFDQVLAQVQQPSLVIGVRGQHRLAIAEKGLPHEQTPNVDFALIEKEDGPHASLLEAEQLDALFHSFFRSVVCDRSEKDLHEPAESY